MCRGGRPEIGCAGRGVITAMDTLNALGVGRDSDFIVYDVLGDVVCGGFAVPMRRNNTDAVYGVECDIVENHGRPHMIMLDPRFDGSGTARDSYVRSG